MKKFKLEYVGENTYIILHKGWFLWYKHTYGHPTITERNAGGKYVPKRIVWSGTRDAALARVADLRNVGKTEEVL